MESLSCVFTDICLDYISTLLAMQLECKDFNCSYWIMPFIGYFIGNWGLLNEILDP